MAAAFRKAFAEDTIEALHLRSGGILVIQAPPGYGKSSLASRLTEEPGCSCVFEDVEPADVQSVLRRLEQALQLGSIVVTTLSAVVSSQIALRFPGETRAVLAGELQCTPRFIARYLDCEEDAPQVRKVMERSGGWPLAAQFALAQPNTSDERFAALLNGFFDSFEDTLFSTGDLRCISVVADFDELQVPVLHSLFDDESVVQTLHLLAMRGAFVHERLDRSASFRLEPAFAAYLRHRYAGLRPDGEAARKARALASLGYVMPALRVAASSRHENAVAEVINIIGGLRVVMSLGLEVAAYMDLPAIKASQHPEVVIARIYLAVQMGRIGHARELMRAARRQPPASIAPYGGLNLVDLILRLYENHDVTLEAAEEFERMHATDLYDDPIARATLQQLRASSHYLRGNFQASFVCARYAMEVSTGLGAPLLAHYANIYVALNQMRAGHLAQAAERLWDVVSASERELGHENPQACQAQLLLARILLEQKAYDQAEAIIARYGQSAELYANWRDAAEMVAVTQARVIERSAGLAAAISYLDDRQTSFMRSGMASCAHICALLKAQILFERGRHAEAHREIEAGVAISEPGLHYQTKIAALLAHRIEVRTGQSDPDEAAFDRLASDIGASGDAAADLRIALTRYEIGKNRERTNQALAALHQAISLASRATLCGTFEAEILGIASDIAADVQKLALTPEEAAFVANCLAETTSTAPAIPEIACGSGLSPREQQVLAFLADGLSSKEMARNLNISVGTIKGYRRKLYDKLNIYRRSDAVVAARQLGVAHGSTEKRAQ